jgi:type IV pilus assembly protein PilA
MKKMVKNNKGFTLIELVIVIAILGVLAAVAITMFPKISSSSRTTADKTRATQIKSAMSTYISESGDLATTNLGATIDAKIDALQKGITDTTSGVQYGPYLENINGGTIISDDYNPQAAGMGGWDIEISADGNVAVAAAAADNLH